MASQQTLGITLYMHETLIVYGKFKNSILKLIVPHFITNFKPLLFWIASKALVENRYLV